MTSRFVLPKPVPEDDHIFEDLVCDVMARQLNCRNMQRYARRGQSQYGVDVAGLTPYGVIGIQCKHHPKTQISISEIDETIAGAENFPPPLAELYIVTSAERDGVPQSHVLAISEQRQQQDKFPVVIVFWDELVRWLGEYPDLVYKYFTQFFPVNQLEHVHMPTWGEVKKETVTWHIEPEELKYAIAGTQQDIPIVSPYHVSMGISTFRDTQFDERVDLQLLLADYFEGEDYAEQSFEELAVVLHEVKQIFNDPFYSRELLIYLNTRLSLAFLVGWIFRRVTSPEQFSLKLIANGQVWASEGLPTVATGLTELLPEMLDPDSSEVAVVLNISRETEEQVRNFIQSGDRPLKSLLVWDLDSHEVRSAAHALSLAREISRKLKALMDKGNITHIHLFGAYPAALATLIGYHLNAIQRISVYFLDSTRQTIRCGGTLHNKL